MNTQTTLTQRINRQATTNGSIANLAMNINTNYDSLIAKLAQHKPKPVKPVEQIEILNGKQALRFSREEIHWVEAAGDYLFIHTAQGKSQLIRKTMKAMEDILGDEQFVRIHRSYIVNINHVKNFGNNKYREKIVTLRNDQQLSVSRRFKSRVSAVLAA